MESIRIRRQKSMIGSFVSFEVCWENTQKKKEAKTTTK